jgi:hypothetical protein
MTYEPRSIADHIACLARLTGAPDSFVVQVKALFGRKGISLDEDATPYQKALEEAFRREENIRFSAKRARANLASMNDDFRRMGRSYVEQAARRGAQAEPMRQAGRSRYTIARGTEIAIKGDHRTFVTRTEREELPLVPGPDDIH